MAIKTLDSPGQQSGPNIQTVKDFAQGGSEAITIEKSSATELLEIADDKGEAVPVPENKRLPETLAPSTGIVRLHLSVIKISVETQTETHLFEPSPDVKLDPEVEVDSNIKEVSTQTLLEANVQPTSEPNIKVEKKKHRPRKKRPSKEKKNVKVVPSRDDTQSKLLSFQFTLIPDTLTKLVYSSMVLLCIFIWISQGVAAGNVKDNGQWHTYRYVTENSLVNLNITIKQGKAILCDIFINSIGKEFPCDNSSVCLINNNTLLLVFPKKNVSLFVEAGEIIFPEPIHEGPFRDLKSALENFNITTDGNDRAAPTPTAPSKIHQPDDNGGMHWWQIVVIVLGISILVAILVAIFFKDKIRSCWENRPLFCRRLPEPQPASPSTGHWISGTPAHRLPGFFFKHWHDTY
ncbi:uncharacterized protein [Pyxicephalus adspersus]|uniref:uncharacterized protein n=1 Tax=Pyxicephalus adspersus TaxID=30357 RepID=UPI003B591FA5